MRRAFVALLGTAAGTALLIGAKYQASPPAQTAGAVGGVDGDGHATSGSPSAGDAPSASTSTPPSPSTSTPPTSAAPGGQPTSPKPATTTTTKPGSASTGGATQPPATTPATTCTTATGAGSTVVKPGQGSVVVTIKVCNGAITSSSGSLSSSNWEPQNTNALKSLNSLTVQYYKTDLSKITFSGATLTSNAYKTSLKSAMTKAGI